MKKIRVGLIGTGFAGRFHLASLRQVYGVNVEMAGVTSLRSESRKAFGQAHGIPVFENVASLLPHVDVIDICSPPSAHSSAMLAAAEAGVHIICEKPLTGYFGPEGCGDEYYGDKDPKDPMLAKVVAELKKVSGVIKNSGVIFCYAENFVYAPSIQKEKEIIEKTGAQVLRIMGEESHSGSGSPVYGIWRFQGGGSLMGKVCHPLTAALFFKRVEGMARNGKPIRPKTVTSRCEKITKLPGYEDKGFLRTEYHDTEDHGWMHVTFEDGTIADVISGEIVLGGINNFVEVFANNHRTKCNLSPLPIVDTFNPKAEQYADIYTVEKISTKEGWTAISPDENFTLGYLAETQDFLSCISEGRTPQADFELACDTITAIYAAYLSDERKGVETDIPLV
ncbi:MAG: Gfo/Idh/MocA family oxidoreductase [Lentisphaerae bacterium]|nr:Gfo/Idh/MocA family oxidoreductase [Lentisphaerota bacterium]